MAKGPLDPDRRDGDLADHRPGQHVPLDDQRLLERRLAGYHLLLILTRDYHTSPGQLMLAAFRRAASFPSTDFGPLDRYALMRFALICAGVAAIGATSD